LNSALAPAMKEIQKYSNKIAQHSFKSFLNEHNKLINRLSALPHLTNLDKFRALLKTIAEEAEEIPKHVDKVHSYLANQAWFVLFHLAPFNAFKEYARLIDNEEHEVIEQHLQNFIKENIPAIRMGVKKQFPDRYRIIETAFEAHKRENYILSIPTLLAQADGMFSDLVDKTFYSNDEKELEDNRKRLQKRLAKNGHPRSTSSLGYLLIKQLFEENIINEDFGEFEIRNNGDNETESLNRHYILHGKAL